MGYYNILLSSAALLSLTSLTAEASLTPGTADGKSVVYSSVSNATWTGDANLLGTLESAHGYYTIVNAIIAASPTIYDTPNRYDTPVGSGHYAVSTSDFYSDGAVSWFGAKAFTTYLNSINYAGSNQWDLPNDVSESHLPTGGQFRQLFYNELGGFSDDSGTFLPDTSYFTNDEYAFNPGYWMGTEFAGNPGWANFFDLGYIYDDEFPGFKVGRMFAWAVSPGNVATLPLPGAGWLFGTWMVGLLVLRRRSNLVTRGAYDRLPCLT